MQNERHQKKVMLFITTQNNRKKCTHKIHNSIHNLQFNLRAHANTKYNSLFIRAHNNSVQNDSDAQNEIALVKSTCITKFR